MNRIVKVIGKIALSIFCLSAFAYASYQPITGSTVTVNGALSDNGAAASSYRLGTLPGIYQKWGAGTGGTLTDNAALEVMPDHGLHMDVTPMESGYSYHASSTVASAASATDICTFQGNASSTTLVYSVKVTGTQTTAGIIPITILRRSTSDYGGTVNSTVTVVSDDPTDYATAESTAVYMWSANPTRGTLVGCIDTQYIGVLASATASPNDLMFESDFKIKPQVLKGANQTLAVSLAAPCDGNGTTVTGGSFSCTWGIIEHPNITP